MPSAVSIRNYVKKWQRANRPYVRGYQRTRMAQRREKAILKLGVVCVRCGFSDHRALQFDHVVAVRGSGKAPQRQRGLILREILQGSTKYQLLCANCNWIKRAQNHDRGERDEGLDCTLYHFAPRPKNIFSNSLDLGSSLARRPGCRKLDSRPAVRIAPADPRCIRSPSTSHLVACGLVKI